MRAPATIIGALSTVLALTACGDTDEPTADPGPAAESEAGDDATEAGGTSAIEVVAEDITFPDTSYEATAGEVEVTYLNEGSINHTLVIEGVDGFKLDVQSNGDEDSGVVELEPGTYTLYCDVPAHRDAGMEATLEVS